jgi:hypothetical protein
MSRKTDLEEHVRESYQLVREYEDILRLTADPKERLRARRALQEQWEYIGDYLAEYASLCQRSAAALAPDIAEIAATAGAWQFSTLSTTQPIRRLPTPAPVPRAGPLPPAYALIAGVAAYRHLPRLSKAAIDARDVHDWLVMAGDPPAQMALLLDEEATKGAIGDKLDWLARRANPESSVLIFFSGHGAQRTGGFEPGEYLCPVEADWYHLRATAISNGELTAALRAIPARRVLVLLDACHSGGVGEPKEAGLTVKAGWSEAGYAQLAAGDGRVVIASCKPGEVSWELPGMRNSLFTHYLLEGLRGAAAGTDGMVRVFELFDYLAQQVPRRQPQHPLFKGQTDLNFAVAVAAGAGTPPPQPSP